MESIKKSIKQCEVCGEVTEVDENDVCAYCYPLVSDEYFSSVRMFGEFAEAV